MKKATSSGRRRPAADPPVTPARPPRRAGKIGAEVTVNGPDPMANGAGRRLAGHRLDNDGAAYWGQGRWSPHPNGVGVGRCECGRLSPVLGDRAARKEWHQQHRDEQRASGKRSGS